MFVIASTHNKYYGFVTRLKITVRTDISFSPNGKISSNLRVVLLIDVCFLLWAGAEPESGNYT